MLITSYEWSGIPGIVVAAPTFQVCDVAYSEQVIKEQWNQILEYENFDVTFPWSYKVAARTWERDKPWWIRI